MPNYTVQVTIPTTDNLAANYASNTWHFFADSDSVLTTVFTALKAFYTASSDRMSNLVRPSDWMIKAYNDADAIPRAPVLQEEWDTGLTFSVGPLPTEVALCLSFQGAPVSGIPQARRRGRIFFPFLNTSQLGTDGRPASACISDLTTNADTLMTAGATAGTWHWITNTSFDPGPVSVVNGWVDNEWDTQRRRGRKATSRTTWS